MSSISQAQPKPGADRRQLLIAGILGLIAAVLVIMFLNSAEDDKPGAAVETGTVVTAAARIEAGVKITDQMIATRELPVSAIPADAIRERGLVVGQVARYPIERGETISAARLVEAPKVQAISFQIPPGLRGMTIPVSITNTPAALIAPGDFVDVIVSVEAVVLTGRVPPTPVAGGNREFKGAATLLQNVQVLSVDRTYIDTGVVYEPSLRGSPRADNQGVSFVTLAVTPEQAQLLWLAQEQGKLTLVLRPFGDDSIAPLTPRLEPLLLP
ncbi:MAG TPA: Flp pilus assembly protein CpaB [Dehalococcoidia bacterium]|nr:Flp pilus assembly protein CpaB [Dehalococcoidia bacterium]